MNNQNKEIISPISFTKESEISSDSSINSLLLMPYETKIVSDITYGRLLEENNKNNIILSNESLSHMKDIVDNKALIETIIAYLKSNIYDITMNTITNIAFEINNDARISEICPNIPLSIDTDTIFTIIRDTIDNSYGFFSKTLYMSNNGINYTYIQLDNFMNIIFAKICSEIIDKFVVDVTTNILLSGNGTKVAQAISNNYLNSDITKDMDYFSKYTFISSLLRSIAQDKLINVRKALTMIAETCTNMIFERIDWCSVANNKNNINTIIKSSAMLGDLLQNILIEDNK